MTFNIKEGKLDKVNQLIKLVNNSKTLEENDAVIYELSLCVDNYPLCTECNKPIVFSNMAMSTKHNLLVIDIPKRFTQTFDTYTFKICKCEHCVRKTFSDFPSMQRYLFMLKTKWAQFIYDIPNNIHEKIRKNKCGVTLQNLINKYGQSIGQEKWKEYCNKQAYSNTFEYKNHKYNWTEEQFNEYNKSRAVTLQNLITKYGDVQGQEKWDEYVKKQQVTKSLDYMVKKYGKDKALQINKSKGITLQNFINKFGEQLGVEKYAECIKHMHKFYSNISQKCFDELDSILGKYFTTYYASKNTEYGVNLGDRYVCLDYYILEKNICIEFNGDTFHANPLKYKDNDKPNPWLDITAKQIRLNDKRRYKDLKNKRNITTFVIWESEYYNNFNPMEYITKILNISID